MITLTKKDELRKVALSKRAEFSKEKSALIVQKILNSSEFKNAKNIALYYPINHEIDLTGLLQIKDKNFYLPRCVEKNMEFAQFCSLESLRKGKFNILEPTSEKINPQILDIIYIPALMANKRCFRLGYGKGFYDRFFKNNQINARKLIVVANELINDNFIEDEFDYKCDGIISA